MRKLSTGNMLTPKRIKSYQPTPIGCLNQGFAHRWYIGGAKLTVFISQLPKLQLLYTYNRHAVLTGLIAYVSILFTLDSISSLSLIYLHVYRKGGWLPPPP